MMIIVWTKWEKFGGRGRVALWSVLPRGAELLNGALKIVLIMARDYLRHNIQSKVGDHHVSITVSSHYSSLCHLLLFAIYYMGCFERGQSFSNSEKYFSEELYSRQVFFLGIKFFPTPCNKSHQF